ncbi:tRNA-modifying protein YgfZ [mine drainage metagenome]|uniref:tRNA-modifying protein YgfZ n=1 Tax=mine drainage metagenome TaxID=410659 RepID=A0A1J5QWN6_9ZZZZ
MPQMFYTRLPHRALIEIGGEDRVAFLQGLVSADIPRTRNGHPLYGAFLTPQGKFLHELFVAEQDGVLRLETETARRADFARRLSLYKLRAKVSLAQPDAPMVYALWGDGAAAALGLGESGTAPFDGGLVLADPRLPEAGLRAWLPAGGETALEAAGFTLAPFTAWDERRIRLALPDGSRDLAPEHALLLENGFDELHGVDWDKGCYMGQELTARTKYRALIRKRLLPVALGGPAPACGAALTTPAGADAGEMRSSQDGVGLALLRLEALEALAPGEALLAGDCRLTPLPRPGWMRLPSPSA